MRTILFASVLLLTSSSALYWTTRPLTPPHLQSADCASCHEGSILNNHTAAFIRADHGPAAHDDRPSCMGCHQSEDDCIACHLAEQPQWHSEAFCDPAGGAKQRDEHVRVAAAHSGACLECHATRFHTQCTQCHTQGEWPR